MFTSEAGTTCHSHVMKAIANHNLHFFVVQEAISVRYLNFMPTSTLCKNGLTALFSNRKLKYTANGGNAIPDWPYYKSIERILSKVPEQAHMSPPSLSASGPSTSQLESSVPQSAPPSGFLPEYTGSSEERDINDDDEGLTENSGSSFETR